AAPPQERRYKQSIEARGSRTGRLVCRSTPAAAWTRRAAETCSRSSESPAGTSLRGPARSWTSQALQTAADIAELMGFRSKSPHAVQRLLSVVRHHRRSCFGPCTPGLSVPATGSRRSARAGGRRRSARAACADGAGGHSAPRLRARVRPGGASRRGDEFAVLVVNSSERALDATARRSPPQSTPRS